MEAIGTGPVQWEQGRAQEWTVPAKEVLLRGVKLRASLAEKR